LIQNCGAGRWHALGIIFHDAEQAQDSLLGSRKFPARPEKFPVPLCGNFSAKGLFASHFPGRSGAAKRVF